MTNYLIANLLLKSGGPLAPFWEAAAIAAIALMPALIILLAGWAGPRSPGPWRPPRITTNNRRSESGAGRAVGTSRITAVPLT